MEQERTINRGPDGRFLPGSKAALGNGKRKNYRLIPEELVNVPKTGGEVVTAAVEKHLDGLVEKLAEQALNGCTTSAGLLLKYAPSTPKNIVRGNEDLADMEIDERISAINARVAAGQLSVEQAQALAGLAKAEMDTRILGPLKQMLMAIKNGAAMEQAMKQLAVTMDFLEHENDAPSIQGGGQTSQLIESKEENET